MNICIDLQRRLKDEVPIDLAPELADECWNPEHSPEARERHQIVLETLKALSPKERQAIVLRDLEGYSTAEVAKMLWSSETTVRSQISTGRVKMKELLATKLGRLL